MSGPKHASRERADAEQRATEPETTPALPVPSLFVGAADDAAERQADEVAQAAIARLSGSTVQRTPAATPASAGPERAVVGKEGGPLPGGVSAEVEAARGSGSTLEPDVRERMETAFGGSLADVRVHTDGRAARLNRLVSARAFTTGRDIFFGAGEYAPATEAGEHVLAHELAHTREPSALRRSWVRRNTTAPTTAPPLNPDQMFMRLRGKDGAVDDIKADLDTFVGVGGDLERLFDFNGSKVRMLHAAAAWREPAMIDHLVTTHGADRDSLDSRGRTALHHAARGNNAANITALDGLGIDVEAVDAAGWTAYDVAVAGGFKVASVQLAGLMSTANPTGPDPQALPAIIGARTTPGILAAATKSMDPSMGPAQILAMYDDLYTYEDLRPILDIAAMEAIESRATEPNALRIFLSDNDSTMLLRNAFPYGSYNDLDQRTSGAITQKLEGTVTVGGSREKTESGGQEVASQARTMLGTLIHELTHHAARKIFDNNAVPLDKGDHAGLQLYLAAYREDSVRWIDETLAPGTSAARKVGFEDIESGYGKLHLQLQEIIVRAPQSLVQFGQVAEKALPSQIQYFRTQFLPRATQFVNAHAQHGQLQNPNAPGKTDFSDVLGVGPETVSLAGLDAAWLAKKVVARLTHGRHTEDGDHATKLDSQLQTGVDTELGGFTDTNRAIGQRQGRGKLHKKADEAAITKALTKAIPKAKPKRFTDKQLEVNQVDDLVAQLATAAQANKLGKFEKILKPFYA